MKNKNIFLLFFCSAIVFIFPLSGQTPHTGLKKYIDNNDPTYAWEIKESYTLDKCKVHTVLLISQKWQGYLWKHQLIVCVPEDIAYNGAMLLIDGGNSDDQGYPKFMTANNPKVQQLSQLAIANKAIVATIRDVPNQPLKGMREDALIAYSLGEYLKTGDSSWPLLFPMVKSAIRAMDAVEDIAKEKYAKEINQFLLAGASKRGWTTWLAAATEDPRIVAIAPMVIEMLNIPEFFKLQLTAYGKFSNEIGDYTEMDMPRLVESEGGKEIVEMIDPYNYLNKITIPKLIFMATNDPFWVVDAIHNYLPAIQGKYALHYVPNAGHNMGDKQRVNKALGAFFHQTLNGQGLPTYTWSLKQDKKIELTIQTVDNQPVEIQLWQATSPTRDFREAKWESSKVATKKKANETKATISFPQKGYKAFFAELIYASPLGETYSTSTSTYVTDNKQVYFKKQ